MNIHGICKDPIYVTYALQYSMMSMPDRFVLVHEIFALLGSDPLFGQDISSRERRNHLSSV